MTQNFIKILMFPDVRGPHWTLSRAACLRPLKSNSTEGHISYTVVPNPGTLIFLISYEGGHSQNFSQKFVRFFVTLGLKILIFFRLKELFEADIIKG
jgi:hypothetical protein